MRRTFFRGANLIDGINRPKPNTTVVVEGERITAVGTSSNTPKPTAQDVVYDLAGKSLMPGMVMCHYHVAYDNVMNLHDIDMKYPATYLALIAAKNAELLLRCGRDLVTTGDSVDCHPDFWKLNMDGLARICDGPDDFRKAVREEIKRGVEMIKLYPTGGHGLMWPADVMTMSQAEIDAAVEAAHERGKKIRGHIISKKGILAGLKANIDVIDHGDMMDAECIEGMVKQGTFVTPSLYFPWKMVEQKRKTGKAGFSGIDEMEKGLEHSYQIIPKAQQAGVKFVIGDDFGIGVMPHGEYTCELEAYVKGPGISPLEVITWATKNGYELLGQDGGIIQAGKLADLLVVNGNPAKDITILQDRNNLDVVMKGGEFVTCQLTPN